MKKFYLFLLCVLACSCTKENIEDTLPVNISFKYNIESGSMYNTRSISNIISQLPVKTQYYLRLESSKCRYLFNVDFNRDTVFTIQPGTYHVTSTRNNKLYELDIFSKCNLMIDTYITVTNEPKCFFLPAKYDCSIIIADILETDYIEFSYRPNVENYPTFRHEGYILHIVKRDPVICNRISATLFPKDSKYEKTSINIDNIELGKYYILHPNKSNYGNGFGLTVEDFIEGTL